MGVEKVKKEKILWLQLILQDKEGRGKPETKNVESEMISDVMTTFMIGRIYDVTKEMGGKPGIEEI